MSGIGGDLSRCVGVEETIYVYVSIINVTYGMEVRLEWSEEREISNLYTMQRNESAGDQHDYKR